MQLRPFVAEIRAKVPVSELPGTRDPVAMVGNSPPGAEVSGDSVKMFQAVHPVYMCQMW